MIDNPSEEYLSFESQAQLLKVLAHPARLAILEILREGEHCVCHMEACLGYRQAYISQQLMVLREAGLIQDRRDGWNIFYRIVTPQVFDVVNSVQKMSRAGKQKAVQPQVDCTCPSCSVKVSPA